jgi:hypothetical protein
MRRGVEPDYVRRTIKVKVFLHRTIFSDGSEAAKTPMGVRLVKAPPNQLIDDFL